jgi:hypothetical protein
MASPDTFTSSLAAVPSDGSVSEGAAGQGVAEAALDPEIYQDQLLCGKCGGTRLHFEIFRFDNGWMISCQGCGDERVVRKLPFVSAVLEA